MTNYQKHFFLTRFFKKLLVRLNFLGGKQIVDIFDRKIVINLSIPGLSHTIFTERYREIDHTNIFAGLLNSKKMILDLGANIGYYLLLEKKYASKDAKIVCIEPDPRNTVLLEETIALNQLTADVTLIKGVVNGTDGQAFIEFADITNLNRLADVSQSAQSSVVGVPSYSLDSLTAAYGPFDCLRMDIEGAEALVLSCGAEKCLRDMPRDSIVFMEIHPGRYIPDEVAMSIAIEKLVANNFLDFQIVTAGTEVDPRVIKVLGRSNKIFKDGPFRRALYESVDSQVVRELILMRPKAVRYLIAQKRSPLNVVGELK